MQSPVVESVIRLLEELFAYDMGSPPFNVMLGVCVLTWVVVARVFMAMFSTKRGIVAAFFAFALPMLIGLLAYGLAEQNAVAWVEQGWFRDHLPLIGLFVCLFLSVVVISKRIFDLSAGVSVFIFIMATAAAIGAYFGAQVTMGVIEAGGGQVEQRERRINEEIDSLL